MWQKYCQTLDMKFLMWNTFKWVISRRAEATGAYDSLIHFLSQLVLDEWVNHKMSHYIIGMCINKILLIPMLLILQWFPYQFLPQIFFVCKVTSAVFLHQQHFLLFTFHNEGFYRWHHAIMELPNYHCSPFPYFYCISTSIWLSVSLCKFMLCFMAGFLSFVVLYYLSVCFELCPCVNSVSFCSFFPIVSFFHFYLLPLFPSCLHPF